MKQWCEPADRVNNRCLNSQAMLLGLLVAVLLLVMLPARALALKPIVVAPDEERLEVTTLGEFYDGRGDSLQVETAAGADGMTGRMSVRAKTLGTSPNWIVFALSNPTDKPIERWLTAERYNVIGSGAVWPDLDSSRIEALTPSIGFVPERIKSDRADIFRITLEPGQTITYVAELSSQRLARIYLWKQLEYQLKTRDRQLFNGIMLGLTGLLAIFLTAIFAANHKAIFPSAALVAWCALAYLCVDFGFFHKLFQLRPEDNAVYRAASESAVAASLVIFLSVFLRIAHWHGLIRMLFAVWIIAQLMLVAVAVIDPRLASTFARMSFLVIGVVGAGFTLFLAFRGQDRALSLIPTWILFLIWIFGTAMVLTGRLSGDMVVSALVAGLVLILVLIGFTVTQFAFRSMEPLYGAAPNELQLRALALDGAGSAVWEWNVRRDEIKVSPLVESSLGLRAGELCAKVDVFIKYLHPTDRERFRLILWSIQERAGARIRTDFRMRHSDNSYRWFELGAASVPSADQRSLRCVGLMRDVTDSKRAHERLLHDAVHDSLTNLPNRELLLDRLSVAFARSKSEGKVRPSLFLIDIDKFKSVNVSFGLVVGDSLLLTVARRLQRHLGEHDTLARVGGDQFAVLLVVEQNPGELASLAERIRRSLRAPIKISGQEIVLTGSVGLAVYDGPEQNHLDLYKEAEIAMYRAKRGGADRIEIFRPEMREDRDDRVVLESDLRKALDRNQIKVFYQPIIYLPTEELAGFEALARWEHPKQGLMNPTDFVPVAEESDLVVRLGSNVLLQAAHEAARWQRELPRDEHPLFVSVNISSRQIFRQNLIQEIRHILARNIVPKGSLRLEITESLVMENPEQATEILQLLRGAGAELALDDFGTGYSSLAYLQRFPFDTIKIDKALVQTSGGSNGAGSAIVRSMVALSHELGKKVVAEGVETSEDVGFLRSIGCHYAQGFYYGEPMSDREVTKLLKMVRTAEHKLRPRGLFRAVPKQKQKAKKMAKKAAAHAPAAALPPPRPNGVKDAPLPKTGHSPPRPSPPQVAIRQPEAVEQGQQGPRPLLDRTGRSPARPALSKQGKRNVPPVPPIPPASPLSPLPQQGTAKPTAGVGDIKGSGTALPIPPELQPQPQPQAMMKSNEPAPGPIVDAKPPASKATSPPVLPPAPPAVAAVSATPSPQSEASLPPAASVPQSNGAGASGASEDAATADADVLAAALRLPPQAKATPVSKSAARPSAKSDEPTQPIQSTRPKPPAGRTPSAADFSNLPPQMAASLAKLAGVPWPPKPDGDPEKVEEPIEESVGATDPSRKQMPPK